MCSTRTHFYEGGTAEQYQVVLGAAHPGGKLPAGQQYHAAGPTDGGWLIAAVWESEASFDKFVSDTLMPALQTMSGVVRLRLETAMAGNRLRDFGAHALRCCLRHCQVLPERPLRPRAHRSPSGQARVAAGAPAAMGRDARRARRGLCRSVTPAEWSTAFPERPRESADGGGWARAPSPLGGP